MKLTRRRALGALGAAAAIPLLSACGEASSGPASVTVMLDWVPNTNHTGLYVAQANGYFAEEELDVTIVEPGTAGVEAAVGSGAASFGVSYQEAVTLARVEDVPVVSIAAVIQHNTSGFASPVDRRIRRSRDFEGKKYGAFGSDVERQVLTSLMECDGGDVNQIEFVDIGFTDPFVAWERGDVDFVWIFEGWTGIEAQLRGIELNFVRMVDLDCVPDYYTPVFVTGEQLIADRPDVVQRWTRAVKRGYDYAIRYPEDGAEILIANAEGINADLVRLSQPWLSARYAEGADRWGDQSQAVWDAYSRWMVDRGLQSRVINTEDAMDNSFIRSS